MITSTLAATCIRENNSSKNQDGKYLPALWCLEPRIFGVQKPGTSGYKYIVGNLGRIIDHYWRKCDSRARHMYELIREKTPCRLYFDLEYCKFANPGKSEEENEQIMKELIEELCQEVKSTYGIHIDRTNIVDLDSSTNKKFSRHLVIHMPNGDLFSDAEACGAFVKHFVGRLCNELAASELQYKQPALAGNLFVRKTPNKNKDKSKVNLLVEGKDTNEPGVFDNDDKEIPQSITEKNVLSEEKSRIKFKIDDVNELSGESRNSAELMNSSDHTCFIDLGVYTRNRLFRVLGSTKIGKPASAALHISSSNEFEFPSGFSNEKFYVPDMEKTTPSNTQTDQDEKNQNDYPKNKDDAISKFKNALNWNHHAEALAQTLIVPVNSSKLPLTLLPNLFEDENSFPYNRSATTNKLASKNGLIKKSKSCSWPSPFVSLDNFIMNVLAKRCGVQGSVRSVSMTCEINDLPTTITYHMKDNRWCERIGRFHKSNNIMWIVDFREMNYYQTCYDVECRACGFKGKLNNLPLDVEESVRDVLFELELAVMDEAQFLSSTTKNDQHTHDKSKQEKYSDSQDDFTVNASFEQALLALDLSSNKNENISEDVEDQVIVKTKQTEKDRSLDVSGDDWNALLSDALDQNPELFP